MVLLPESLSSKNAAFTKLIRLGNPGQAADGSDSSSTEVRAGNESSYRQNRMLSPAEQADLVTLYEAGASMLELAKKFECHRHTIARHLQRADIELRPQIRVTPELVAQGTALYGQGHSLAEVGRLLGLEASTIGKALKRAGVQLRPPVADRRLMSGEW